MSSKDTVLYGGLLCDGTGKQPVLQDLLIRNDRIADLGEPGAFDSLEAEKIDISGCMVAPGFIDIHAHGDLRKILYPENRTKLLQGVTTEVDGNCGNSKSCIPGNAAEYQWQNLAEYAKTINDLKISTNTVVLCGHNSIRFQVLGNTPRKPDQNELREMQHLLENACSNGAAGFSTGLTYFPGKFADTNELCALSEVLKNSKKIYASHIRSEGDTLIESIHEAAKIANAGSRRLQVSHLKTIFPQNFHKIGDLLKTLKQYKENSMFLHADRYPYIYSSTGITQILPSPYDKDPELPEKLHTSEKIRQEVTAALKNSPRDLASTILMKNGKTLAEIAAEQNCSLETAGLLALMENPAQDAAYLCMSEENMMKILSEPWVCPGSDGLAMQLDDPQYQGHPRSVGTFPTFYRLVRELTSIPEAIRRMTSLPADILGLEKRGRIQKDYFADLVVFDPVKYDSHAGFDGRNTMPTGVKKVFVNGTLAWNAENPDQVVRNGSYIAVNS